MLQKTYGPGIGLALMGLATIYFTLGDTGRFRGSLWGLTFITAAPGIVLVGGGIVALVQSHVLLGIILLVLGLPLSILGLLGRLFWGLIYNEKPSAASQTRVMLREAIVKVQVYQPEAFWPSGMLTVFFKEEGREKHRSLYPTNLEEALAVMRKAGVIGDTIEYFGGKDASPRLQYP